MWPRFSQLSTQFPELMELMIAELHKEVPVSVPMSFVHDPSLLSTAQYYRLMGFKERDGVNPGDPKVWMGGREGSRSSREQEEGAQDGRGGRSSQLSLVWSSSSRNPVGRCLLFNSFVLLRLHASPAARCLSRLMTCCIEWRGSCCCTAQSCRCEQV